VVSQIELEAIIRKTVLLYNRINSPKVVTKSVFILPELVTIAFSGSFCYECGSTLPLVEDFAKDFKIFTDSVELTLPKTRQTSPRSFEVDYIVKSR
jgi:hypothetical protein